MQSRRVLVVDDDADIRRLVRTLLEGAGYAVSEAADGREALRQFFDERPDLVILDAAMPFVDGWQALERIRELSNAPVIMLTAHAQEPDKVRGLRAGANDYVTKPFGRQELLARVEAQLRQSEPSGADETTYADGHVGIDFAQRSVTVAGREVSLTPLEFKLLSALVKHPNQVLTQEQLLDLVWGEESSSRDQVRLYVRYLRAKLGQTADGTSPIETVRGFGYRYRATP